jgi:hypothetical protein
MLTCYATPCEAYKLKTFGNGTNNQTETLAHITHTIIAIII